MEIMGLSGYLIASIGYLIFILLFLAARNNTLLGRLLLLFAVLSLCSAILAALQIEKKYSLEVIFYFDALKLAVCSVLILGTKEKAASIKELLKKRQIVNYLVIWLVLCCSAWFATYYVTSGSIYFFPLFLILNLWTAVLLEQLYRNAGANLKWALWPLIIALGTVCIFDFVMFAQAAMINALDFDLWYSRGFVASISLPFLLISTRRMKNWSVNIFVSRNVVFYSSMLMISGIYLLIMASAGYVIRYLGGQWGSMFSIAFVVLGTMVLAALLMTERLRREVKVFITKHFFANKYDYRIEWLKMIEQLEQSKPEQYYQTATEIICGSLAIKKGALIKALDNSQFKTLYSEGYSFTNHFNHELVEVKKFCQEHGWIIDIREYASVENSYPNLNLNIDLCRELNIGIIVPIFIDQKAYGFFLLSSPDEAGLLNWEDRDLLFAISKQLSNFLSLNEANEQLAQSKQFDAFNRMSAFLVHDLKNIQGQLALINTNAKRHRDNPEFIDDVFETIGSATSRLDKVLAQLRNKQVAETKASTVIINQLIDKIIEQRNIQQPHISAQIDEQISMKVDSETFSSILNHLLQNAQEATANDGWVTIKASAFDNKLNLAISDNGIGMSEQFIKTRLFKPFDTTKGNAGMGIGVFEAKQFIDSSGGTIQVTSFEGKGTTFHITLPLQNDG